MGEAIFINKICCIGAGYVGGPTMAVIAEKCPHIKVTVVDISIDKIKAWNSSDLNHLPVYEPGLSDIVAKTRNKNLFFSNDIEKAIEESEMIFVAVNTPTKTYGKGKGMASDLTYVENCARKIAEVSNSYKIVVEKSTLPVRTAQTIKTILKNSTNDFEFDVLSNPEFLAEGTAIHDLSKSDRVLIGGENSVSGKKALNSLIQIYLNWVPIEKIVTTNLWSSELSKLVANAFLAQRISSINSISALCEVSGADVNEVSIAIGSDSRIGSKFLNSSVGFGGSCFQKDILNLVYLCKTYGLHEVAEYWENVIKINNYQKNRFSDKIISSLFNSINKKKISILGWAFKKNTNDSRESASIYVTANLLNEGALIFCYDPKVDKNKMNLDLRTFFEFKGYTENKINELLSNFKYSSKLEPCLDKSHAIVILTEWDEFKSIDFEETYLKMEKPSFVFDGRKILNKNELEKIGFNCYEIGK